MFPIHKAEVEPADHDPNLRLDPGTKMVPAPKAGRQVMAITTVKHGPSIDRDRALALARDVMRLEADALYQLSSKLNETLVEAAQLIAENTSVIHITGIGKAGIVGQKLAATAASLGFRCFFLHPAEAVHGDMGRIARGDLVIALSQSGESEEVLRLFNALKTQNVTTIAMTESDQTPLGRMADLTVPLGRFPEACPMGLAPTTSSTAMMAVGDALAVVAAQAKGILPEHFAANHPAGKLGRRLAGVAQIMRTGRHVRMAFQNEIVRDVLTRLGGARRRSGAILVLDQPEGRLIGIFTDSDLVRLLERGRANMLDQPIGDSMTASPSVICHSATVADAVEALKARKLSELPVVDENGHPIGLVDVTDLIGLVDASDIEEGVDL